MRWRFAFLLLLNFWHISFYGFAEGHSPNPFNNSYASASVFFALVTKSDVHTADTCYFIDIDLRKIICSVIPSVKFPLPSKLLSFTPLKSANAWQCNWNQTIQEFIHIISAQCYFHADRLIGTQLEVRNIFLELVDTHFWPVMRVISSSATSIIFLSCVALPTPWFTDIFNSFGICMELLYLNLSCSDFATSSLYFFSDDKILRFHYLIISPDFWISTDLPFSVLTSCANAFSGFGSTSNTLLIWIGASF